MSLFPRLAVGEFAPVFRLLDDFATQSVARSSCCRPTATYAVTPRSFQPRFDVRESREGYELQGELPGIDSQDMTIEFTDAQTLTVKGRSERSAESRSSQPEAIAQPAPEHDILTPSTTNKAGSEASGSKFHKATVEDDGAAAGPSTTAAATETESQTQVAATQQSSNTSIEQQQQQQPQQQQHRYWVSERSTGSFQRTFRFSSRVDQDNVRASLRNGILSIVVPKAAPPVSRTIQIA